MPVAAKFVSVSVGICLCELLGAGWSPRGGAVPAGTPTQQVSVVSLYLVARPGVKDDHDAKRIGNRLVNDYLKALSGRAKFVNKDYEDIHNEDCGGIGTCEVIQVMIEEQQNMVTYGIESRLLPQAPDRPIWNVKEPLSCDITPDRPASQCVEPMLHVLANKVVAHDTNVHRPPQ